MIQNNLHNIWEISFENEELHNNKSSIILEPISVFFRLFEASLNKPKVASIIINSFLNYIITEKKFSHKDFTTPLQNLQVTAIKKLLLHEDYSITKNDTHLFAYSQTLLSPQEKIIFQANNANNSHYKELAKKYGIQQQSTITFDEAFDTVIAMLNYMVPPFQKINQYIENNSIIWHGKIVNTKNQWLPQNYNERIFKKINNLHWTILKNNSEDAKKFFKLAGVTLDGFEKNSKFFHTFVPWFIENLDVDEWDKFTKNWESKTQLTRGKKACEFILKSEQPYLKQLIPVIANYNSMLHTLISAEIPPDRAFWWTKVFLTDAIYYVNSPENKKNREIKHIRKNLDFITNIPENALNSQLEFIEWLSQNKLITTVNYVKLKPILEQDSLEQKINYTQKISKKHKI